jgi:hypothetical protein
VAIAQAGTDMAPGPLIYVVVIVAVIVVAILGYRRR